MISTYNIPAEYANNRCGTLEPVDTAMATVAAEALCSRKDGRRRRAQAATDLDNFGVYLSLPVAAWAQSE
ncbi:hypothetical protein OG339_41920 [Streptosporangium sp. NBC_01495]|uniref:hypothetical protein n=1 Tax=Streptosporangium sp. NBC_01495 TaxID=2903899 RepID=UPI002E35A463|nr:hypothetical protein [Streptosporangium sp. NBC_01495]